MFYMEDVLSFDIINNDRLDDIIFIDSSFSDIVSMLGSVSDINNSISSNNSNNNYGYYDDIYLDNDLLYSDRLIYFYDDLCNKSDFRIFYDLHEFELFCNSHGYVVYGKNYDILVNGSNYIIYCCLSDLFSNNIVCDVSYGSLYWSVFVNGDKDDLPY